MQSATLAILLKGNPVTEVLLGYKKIGLGQGKFTGFGGKIESGEEVPEAALRELTEETSVIVSDPDDFEFSAILEFFFPQKREWEQRVFVFLTHNWQGTPTESDEIVPHWFKVDEIPYDQMWDDGRYWLPRLLSGEKFQAQFEYQANNVTVNKAVFKPLNDYPTCIQEIQSAF